MVALAEARYHLMEPVRQGSLAIKWLWCSEKRVQYNLAEYLISCQKFQGKSAVSIQRLPHHS